VIHYLLDKTGLPHRWKEDLEQIFARHPGVDIADLGFPKTGKPTLAGRGTKLKLMFAAGVCRGQLARPTATNRDL